MSSDSDGALNCPKCNRPMSSGYVGFWNPMAITKVAWKRARPGFLRFRVPPDAEVVLEARETARIAYFCEVCRTVVIPADLK